MGASRALCLWVWCHGASGALWPIYPGYTRVCIIFYLGFKIGLAQILILSTAEKMEWMRGTIQKVVFFWEFCDLVRFFDFTAIFFNIAMICSAFCYILGSHLYDVCTFLVPDFSV